MDCYYAVAQSSEVNDARPKRVSQLREECFDETKIYIHLILLPVANFLLEKSGLLFFCQHSAAAFLKIFIFEIRSRMLTKEQ